MLQPRRPKQIQLQKKPQLNKDENSGKIDAKRIVLWSKLVRLVVAALYLVCEINLGTLPDEVKIGGKNDKK
jgi:hypothetical protein